jgi:hypothetical protein
MKKLFAVFLAAIICIAFVSVVYAQSAVDQATKAATGKTGTPSASEAKAKTEAHVAKQPPGSCKQILETCKNAGFVYGEWKEGEGLYRDCVDPIMQGRTKVPKATKPLPTVDPKLVTECKELKPGFGSGKVGSKQGNGAPGK